MNDANYWHFNQFAQDSVPGINAKNVSPEFPKSNNMDKIVIALIDSDVDINHKYLKNNLWYNKHEIADNHLDDDGNGYIDDKHGWNYLASGSTKLVRFANNTSIRYIREFKSKFQELNKEGNELSFEEEAFMKTYNSALESKNSELSQLAEYKEYISWYENSLVSSDSLLMTYGIERPYSEGLLDSLFNKVYTIGNDEIRGRLIYFALDDLQNNRAKEYEDSKVYFEQNSKYASNKDFDENEKRNLLKQSTNSTNAGSPNVNINIENEVHGTEMAGVLIKTFSSIYNESPNSDNLEIMVLSIFPENGAEHDEDLSKAIRYAVDNDAQIINYSSTLNYLVKPESVYLALEYAKNRNVLFVTSAGNTGDNLDEVMTHPRGSFGEFELSNVIMVGGVGAKLTANLKPIWACYGKNTVDLFAPGTNFTTTSPLNQYHETSGSSISTALVTGVAASIKYRFPKLSSRELKEVIVNSTSKYNGEVYLDEDSEKKVPFEELSKSGGILNAKRAFELASKL